MAHLGPSSKASRPHTTLAQLEVGCYQLGYRYAGDMRTSYFVLFDMQKEHENLTLARSGSHCASAAFDTRLASTNDPTISCHHLRCDDIVPWFSFPARRWWIESNIHWHTTPLLGRSVTVTRTRAVPRCQCQWF